MNKLNVADKYINKRFGKLTILDYLPASKDDPSSKFSRILYICDCGTINIVFLNSNIKNNKNMSCGCYRKQLITKHKMAGTSEYNSWTCMRYRCLNKMADFYHRYGGRGIKICKRWATFENFLADMGEKPEPKRLYSIDRINNDGNYEPENCRWATPSQQQLNKKIIRPTRKCSFCAREFKFSKSSNRKYCSIKCYHLSKKEVCIRVCAYCKEHFQVRAKSDKNKNCSRSCGALSRNIKKSN